MKRITLLFLLGSLFGAIASLSAPPAKVIAQTKIVTAAQVNGTWEKKEGEFKIWALGQNRLKIEFLGNHSFKSAAGPMANSGSTTGIAKIEGITAILKPEDTPECEITMQFTNGKLVVTQKGDCGFPEGVTAAGTYRKTSNRKPEFLDD